MENKTKFITIGLIVGLMACFFLFIQTLSSKQLILRERDALKEENITLNSKLDKIEKGIREYENKIGLLNKELDKVSREKQEVERKYELASKDRENMLERLKLKQVETQAAPQPQAQVLPQDTDAYWAGILKAKTDLELQLGNLRSELRSAQITNEQLQREKSTLELDMKNLGRENEDLKRQLEYNQKIMDSITQELVREKNDKTKIQEILKSMKSENVVLMRQLKSLNERKINLEKKSQGLQEKNAAIEQKFNDMQTMLTDKLPQINDLKEQIDAIRSGGTPETRTPETQTAGPEEESVELPPIVVKPQTQTQAQAETPAWPKKSMPVEPEGTVLETNRENNFVVIDLGQDVGIKPGDTFKVYKQGKVVGTIEVIQARQSISACDIKKEIEPIEVGDTIR